MTTTSGAGKVSENEISDIVHDLLAHLEVKAEVEVRRETEETGERFFIQIQTEETGLLIGRHGETINSIQLIIGVILFKKFGEWVHTVVDIGNYREAREKSIREMVERIAQEVEATMQPVVMPYLSPFERRIVHMMLSEHPKVMSLSEGEGRDRRITIKPR